MTGAVLVENFCIGLATAGFFAFLMSQCDARYSAFQYALFTCLMASMRYVVGPFWGIVQESVGWTWFFAGAALVGVPSLFLIPWLTLPDDRPSAAT
jgi:PAT family beta-lactamase induction signal transducer AmpG